MKDSQDIETATTAVEVPESVTAQQPDSKTRRYDRQLRLWAATGQSALESARILVLGASATSTSTLKNLVLPGIGHFTILDPGKVTPEDAGNNFFLEGADSIGKMRAEEAVRLLLELNDGVDGKADTSDLAEILSKNPSYITTFNLVIAHNLPNTLLQQLSELLWSDSAKIPLMIIRSAGFLADTYIQYHEHCVIDSHPDTAPSLRIDKPFPELLEHATKLNFDGMDVTDHGHIPYVVILVRAVADWKKNHDGKPPVNKAEQTEFKKLIEGMMKKSDEENFEEAIAQAYRCWTETKVPYDIAELFKDPGMSDVTASSSPFFQMLSALKEFTSRPPHTLPLTSTLPDMKSDTANYIHLQKLYKKRSEEEKAQFEQILHVKGFEIAPELASEFVRNAHGLKILRSKKWGHFDADAAAIGEALMVFPREAATHLALSALSSWTDKHPGENPTTEGLQAIVQNMAGAGVELPSEVEEAVGEVARTPSSDLPNVAAFLGGLAAQEAIKIITKQYVPIKGISVIDLITSTTGTVGA